STSGPVAGRAGLTWGTVNSALWDGRRGLPGGDSLARLLRRCGRIGERRGKPPDRSRWARVLSLRARGFSQRQIAARLGVTIQAVSDLLKRAAGAAWREGRRRGG